MGLVNAKLVLKNPRRPDLEPLEVDALADSGAIPLCIPPHVQLQLSSISVPRLFGRMLMRLGRSGSIIPRPPRGASCHSILSKSLVLRHARDVRLGSKAEVSALQGHVRFTLRTRHRSRFPSRQLWAKKRREQMQ